MMNKIYTLQFHGLPILEQLRIEEALLRTDDRSFCLINYGSPPAIVLGISGQIDELVHLDQLSKTPMEMIRRYSGGGTVVVDHNTLFVTFILNSALLTIPPYPERILRWSEEFYRGVFLTEGFALRENDYVFSQKKFGGNAQYIKKDRFVHHTTFLWDYDETRMQTLKMPKKRPTYRGDRMHEDFICRLKDYCPSLEEIGKAITNRLGIVGIPEEFCLHELEEIKTRPHRKATSLCGDL